MAPLRWGICSAGRISHDFVVGVKTLPEADHQVVAVAARSGESAAQFAGTHSIPRHYGSYAELAADGEVDVVYIGTVPIKHVENVLMMFEAGKHVICEKPLTSRAEDTKTLIKAARDKGVFFMEAVWMRFFPAMVKLRQLISEGTIGEVKYVEASLCFPGDKEAISRLSNITTGSGGVLDVGVYPINLATMIFGEKPEAVQSSGWLMPTGADGFGAITLKYSGERVAQLTYSFVVEKPCDALVVGTEGIIKVPAPFWCPEKLETPGGTLEFPPLPPPYLPTKYLRSEGLCYEAEAVRQCILNGQKESDVMTLDHTQIVADIMDIVMRDLGCGGYK